MAILNSLNVHSYSRETYDKSVHTGEEPHIYDFIIVSLINKHSQ